MKQKQLVQLKCAPNQPLKKEKWWFQPTPFQTYMLLEMITFSHFLVRGAPGNNIAQCFINHQVEKWRHVCQLSTDSTLPTLLPIASRPLPPASWNRIRCSSFNHSSWPLHPAITSSSPIQQAGFTSYCWWQPEICREKPAEMVVKIPFLYLWVG